MLKGEDLSAAYASADIFVMPSESETLGFVAMEVRACCDTKGHWALESQLTLELSISLQRTTCWPRTCWRMGGLRIS